MNLTQRLRSAVARFVTVATPGSIAWPAEAESAKNVALPHDSNRRELRLEMGAGGVSYIAGIIDSDEFNAKLTGLQGVQTYDKMRRTDAQVGALINTCSLPLLGARWDVERPSDKAEALRITDEHLDFARHNLFTRINFPAFLRHAVSCMWAGFAWCERVYDMEGDRLVLKRLSPRLATTVEKWHVDDNGELIGLQQRVWRQKRYQYIDYPRDKVSLIVFQQEANCYEGMSILRPVFKPWYIKDVLYKLDAIRAERFAVGVPNIVLPPDYDQKMYTMAQEIGAAWKGAEQSYLISVQGMEVKIVQIEGGASLDLMKMVQHHNEEIAKVGLAQFINFGTTQSGSRALGESAMGFFYDAAEGWAKSLASAIEHEVLWPLMDYNFEDRIRPVVVIKDLGAVSLELLTNTLSGLGETFLTPSLEIENAVRERLNLPPMTEEQWAEKLERQAEERKAKQAPASAPGTAPGRAPRGAKAPKQQAEPEDVEKVEATTCDHDVVTLAQGYWRPLRPAEEVVNLGQIAGTLDDTRDRIVQVLKDARDAWMGPLMEQIQEAWPEGPQAIVQTEIPYAALRPARQELLRLQARLFAFGQEEAIGELQTQARRQGRTLPELEVKELFTRREPMDLGEMAEVVEERTDLLLTRLKRTTEEAAWSIAMGEFRVQGPDALSEAEIREMMADIFDRAEIEARLVASMSVTETLNLGRQEGFAALAESGELEHLEYSAILDGNVCPNCRAVDGRQFAYASPEFYDLQPPLRSKRWGRCRGAGACRCLLVGVLREEG